MSRVTRNFPVLIIGRELEIGKGMEVAYRVITNRADIPLDSYLLHDEVLLDVTEISLPYPEESEINRAYADLIRNKMSTISAGAQFKYEELARTLDRIENKEEAA